MFVSDLFESKKPSVFYSHKIKVTYPEGRGRSHIYHRREPYALDTIISDANYIARQNRGAQIDLYIEDEFVPNYEWQKGVEIGPQGVAEGLGLYGPFTATINTGERPQSRTKTKKFRREDDAILWAEDWLEDFPQYSFATAEVTDPDGNVVWTTDEQGVAETTDSERQADRNARIIAGEIEDAKNAGDTQTVERKTKELLRIGYVINRRGELERLGMESQEQGIVEGEQLNELEPKDEKNSDSKKGNGDVDPEAKKQSVFAYKGRNPEVRDLLRQAYKEFPAADNDLEALMASVGIQRRKNSKMIQDLENTINRQQRTLRAVNAELKDTEDRLEKAVDTNDQQALDIQNLVKGQQLRDRDAAEKEKRFQDLTAVIAAQGGLATPVQIKGAQQAKELERQHAAGDTNKELQRYQKVNAGMYEAVGQEIARYYFQPIATKTSDLINKFGLKQQGSMWYLSKTNTSGREFDRLYQQAVRAFGQPREEKIQPTRAGYGVLTKSQWQEKIRVTQELQKDKELMNDPESRRAVTDRMNDLLQIGNRNGWISNEGMDLSKFSGSANIQGDDYPFSPVGTVK